MSRYIYDVVLLLPSSYHFKLCENLRDEDNLNNTFSLKTSMSPLWHRTATKLTKRCEILILEIEIFSVYD